jgi:y4mF family transcriptional regulator
MAEFTETATERLLREERERQKLFGAGLPTSLSSLFPQKSSVEQALEEAVRPYKEQQRLLDAIDPLRHVRGTLADAFSDPVRDQRAELQRGYGSAHSSRAISGGHRAAIQKTIDSEQTPTNPQITTAADLGVLIRKARKTLKLSQGAFAEHAGVGRRFVSELEAGKPSLEFDKVLACAAAAGVDITARPRRAG